MRELPKKWSDYLQGKPESGMGYQIVTVTLRDGLKFEVAITDSHIIGPVRGYTGVPFAPEEIVDIEVIPDWRVRKHGVAFERAAEVFHDPLMLSLFDEEHSADEERWVTIGKVRDGVPLVVVHTFQQADARTCTIRIISARRATKREVKQYSAR